AFSGIDRPHALRSRPVRAAAVQEPLASEPRHPRRCRTAQRRAGEAEPRREARRSDHADRARGRAAHLRGAGAAARVAAAPRRPRLGPRAPPGMGLRASPRRVDPEGRDALPADHPEAIRSRSDLRRLNGWMNTLGTMTRLLERWGGPSRVPL